MLPQEVHDRIWQEKNSNPGTPAPSTTPDDISTIPAPLDRPSACKKSKKAWKVKDPFDPKKPPTVFFLFFHSLKVEVTSIPISFDVAQPVQPGDEEQARDVLQGGDGQAGEGLERVQRQRQVSIPGKTQAPDG